MSLRRLALMEKQTTARTGPNGDCSFSWEFPGNVLNSWTMVQQVQASASWLDRDRGITFSLAPARYVRSGPREWSSGAPLVLSLSRDRDADPGIPLPSVSVLNRVASKQYGEELAWTAAEMIACLQSHLPTAAVSVAGRALGQAIWLKGQGAWWDPAWDSERPTLGPLLDKTPVRAAIEKATSPGFYQRVRRSFLIVRNDASHGIDTPITLVEARACADLVRQLLEAWWSV